MNEFDDEANEITKVDSPDRPLVLLIPQGELAVPEPMLSTTPYESYELDMGCEIAEPKV